MKSEQILSELRRRSDLASALADLCDFDVRGSSRNAVYFRLESGRTFEPVAGEGAGGVFCILDGPDAPGDSVFFVSSEGQGGFVAHDLVAALGLVVALPYWFDSLKFSRGGNLSEMHRTQPILEGSLLRSHPETDTQRHFLRVELGLPLPAEPIDDLHRAVSSGEGIFNVSDGWKLDPLFNSFGFDHLVRGR